MNYGFRSTINREISPRQVLYSTDGLGRDTYINYNNGGFWKDNEKMVSSKDMYDIPKHFDVRSLRKNVAPLRYYSDGTGRDTYVIHESGGLKRDHKALRNFHLKDFLRTPESAIFNFRASPLKEGTSLKTMYISKREFDQNLQLKKVEKGLKERLYYGEQHKFINVKVNQPKKYHLMLRSHENFFPNIEKNTKKEKLSDFDTFTYNLNKLNGYALKSPKEFTSIDASKTLNK